MTEGSFAKNHRAPVWLQTAALQLVQTLLPRVWGGTSGDIGGKRWEATENAVSWEWLLTRSHLIPSLSHSGKEKKRIPSPFSHFTPPLLTAPLL